MVIFALIRYTFIVGFCGSVCALHLLFSLIIPSFTDEEIEVQDPATVQFQDGDIWDDWFYSTL